MVTDRHNFAIGLAYQDLTKLLITNNGYLSLDEQKVWLFQVSASLSLLSVLDSMLAKNVAHIIKETWGVTT